jgi:hypothetical protein
VLLFGKGANTLLQLGLGELHPDRLLLTIAMALLSVVAALLLLAGGRWGWLLAVAVIGGDLVGEIALWWFGVPDYVAMALLTLCAFLVTSPEMRRAFVEEWAG